MSSNSRRSIIKRRKLSPKIFPKKIHVTDEVVAQFAELNLIHNRECSSRIRQRSFLEIEASLNMESDDEEATTSSSAKLVVASEFQEIMRQFKRGLLRTSIKKVEMNPNICTALVLYKQPEADSPSKTTKSVMSSTEAEAGIHKKKSLPTTSNKSNHDEKSTKKKKLRENERPGNARRNDRVTLSSKNSDDHYDICDQYIQPMEL